MNLHTFFPGAHLLGARLASCVSCGTLRVEEAGEVHYIRRVASEEERVRALEPPCMALPHFRAPW